jgi:hypothetical protein
MTSTVAVPGYASGRFSTWVAVLGGIVFWMVHLTAEAALVGAACHHSSVKWVMHLLTVATAVATLAAMAVCLRMVHWARHVDGGEDSPTVPGRTLFLGLFGLITGAASLLLIVLEGAYVVFFNPCS